MKRLATENRDERVLINDSGGIPLVRTVLLASARLRFGFNRVFFARSLESSPDQSTDSIAPEESLNDRRLVLEAVENGHFDAAARIALASRGETGRKIPGTQIMQTRASRLERWRSIPIVVAQCLHGDHVGLTHLPKTSESRTALQKIAEYGFVALAGLAVENALRRGDLPQAIFETSRFYETCEKEPDIDPVLDPRMRRLHPRIFGSPTPGALPFREIRNIASHDVLTRGQIALAVNIAEDGPKSEKAFWDLSAEYKFLKCPLIEPLCTRDGQLVADLLRRLIEAIREDLDTFSFTEDESRE